MLFIRVPYSFLVLYGTIELWAFWTCKIQRETPSKFSSILFDFKHRKYQR